MCRRVRRTVLADRSLQAVYGTRADCAIVAGLSNQNAHATVAPFDLEEEFWGHWLVLHRRRDDVMIQFIPNMAEQFLGRRSKIYIRLGWSDCSVCERLEIAKQCVSCIRVAGLIGPKNRRQHVGYHVGFILGPGIGLPEALEGAIGKVRWCEGSLGTARALMTSWRSGSSDAYVARTSWSVRC
jgi:hypothetical protein